MRPPRRTSAATLAVLVGLALGADALAQAAGDTVLVTLSTGETLRGALVSRDDKELILDHPALGKVTINAAKVSAVAVAPPLPGATPATPETPAQPSPADVGPGDVKNEPPKPPPPPEPPVKWTGTIEAGLNGSEGNTEQMSFRAGAEVHRLTKNGDLTLRGIYRYKSEDGDKTQNELFTKERYDWFLNPSKWLVFAEANQEYNEFKDYNWRIDFLGGVGYRFIDDDTTKLTGRVGAGVAREFGGANDDWYPIALASIEFTHQITERIAIALYGEYKPDLSDFENFQLLGRAGLDIALNDSKSLFLRFGIEDRYDNDPGPGTESNDIDYFAAVLYKF